MISSFYSYLIFPILNYFHIVQYLSNICILRFYCQDILLMFYRYFTWWSIWVRKVMIFILQVIWDKLSSFGHVLAVLELILSLHVLVIATCILCLLILWTIKCHCKWFHLIPFALWVVLYHRIYHVISVFHTISYSCWDWCLHFIF